MTMHRQIFAIDTDTGTQGDTGPSFWGSVEQVYYKAETADTGADLQILQMPKNGDTGEGFRILNETDALGTSFRRVPRQPTHDVSGAEDVADTGTPAEPVPFFGAGDRLRVKVTPGGAAVKGRLYVYTQKH